MKNVRTACDTFLDHTGRRPRILVIPRTADKTTSGRHAPLIHLADMGFDLDLCPFADDMDGAAQTAVENDVHAVGLAMTENPDTGHVEALIRRLNALDAGDILVFCGIDGKVDENRRAALLASGARVVFTKNGDAAPAALALLKAIEDPSA